MSPNDENPCEKGLTSKCFAAHPGFAKRTLALRLLYLLAPPEITARLPGKLREAFNFPGASFPPGWLPGDPWPESPYFWDPVTWPEGYYMPPGSLPPPSLPEGAENTGPDSPMFLGGVPFKMSGPWHHPPPYYAHKILDEQCATINEAVWTLSTNGDYVFDVVNYRWHYKRNSGYPYVSLMHYHTQFIRDNNNINFTFTDVSSAPLTGSLSVRYYSGNYLYGVKIYPPDKIQLRETSGYVNYAVPDFTLSSIVVLLECRGALTSFRVNGQYIAQDKPAKVWTASEGRLWVYFESIMECYFDTLQHWI